MEKFMACGFYRIGSGLMMLKHLATDAADPKQARETSAQFLAIIEECCRRIGLRLAVKSIQQLAADQSKLSGPEIATQLDEIERRINDEMEAHLFMYIPPSRAARYNDGISQAFGAEVAAKFPSQSFDITEAGNCFAAARYTACVFHLMRVLEVALGVFGEEFGLVMSHTNWAPIVEQIESEIRARQKTAHKTEDQKNRLESLSQAASSFMIFKDAWRNYTAHSRGKYTEEEADAIYRNVCSFCQRLTAMGFHEQNCIEKRR